MSDAEPPDEEPIVDPSVAAQMDLSRRQILAALGLGAFAGVSHVGAQVGDLEGPAPDDLHLGALSTSLTELRKKPDIYTGPQSAFDKSELDAGEPAIVTDDFGLGVKGENGTMEVPPLGSSSNPSPAVTTEVLGNDAYANEYATSGTGTEDNPWMVDPNDPLDDIAATEAGLGSLYFPTGIYRLTQPVDLRDYIVSYQADPALSGVDEIHAIPSVWGAGRHSTTIIRDDNMDSTLFPLVFDSNSPLADGDTVLGGGIGHMTIVGNKGNNTGGSCIDAQAVSSRRFFQFNIRDLYIRRFNDHAVRLVSGTQLFTLHDIDANRMTDDCFVIGNGTHFVSKCNANLASSGTGRGFYIGGGPNFFYGIRAVQRGGMGIRLDGDHNRIYDIHLSNNSQNSGDSMQMYIDGTANDNHIYGGYIDANGQTDYGITDAGLDNVVEGITVLNENSKPINDTGTRNITEGRVSSPETLDLGGTDGTVSPTSLRAEVIPVLIDAGGSATELEGIGGNTRREGQTVRVIHTGGENVTLVHNDTTVTDPLVNEGGANVTLGTNGDMAEYTYSTQASKWIMTGKVTTQ